MEDKHRYAIRRNKPQLIRELDIESQVCDILIKEGILTEFDVERVTNLDTCSKRNREFLNILCRKGDEACPKFLAALEESKQYHLRQAVESEAAKWTGR